MRSVSALYDGRRVDLRSDRYAGAERSIAIRALCTLHSALCTELTCPPMPLPLFFPAYEYSG
ncbi:MAG: hypothetical protein JWN24_2796 [Phycisphaerales bacterium]|nr:hypothetical protein [Phycisphaerales bacterium]